MKKKIATALIVSLASLAAFAQGRLSFANDSLHLVYYNPDVFPPPMGGSLVYGGNMPAGVNLVADLYLGTASSALSLISSTTFSSSAPGRWNTTSVTVPGIPGGTTVFITIQVRDGAFAPEALWTPSFAPPSVYWGFSVEFPFTLGTSGITYPSIVEPPNPPWPRGTYPIPGGGGALGAIAVGYIPEPSAIALAGLACFSILIQQLRGKCRLHSTR